jgi:hypothetical protein
MSGSGSGAASAGSTGTSSGGATTGASSGGATSGTSSGGATSGTSSGAAAGKDAGSANDGGIPPVDGGAEASGSCSGFDCRVCGGVLVDTSTDPRNCGSCGHDCGGGGCSAACLPWEITAHTNPWSLATDGINVAWSDLTTGIVAEAPLSGTKSILLSVPNPATGNQAASVAMAGGRIAWTVASPSGVVEVWSATDGVPNSGARQITLSAPFNGVPALEARAAIAPSGSDFFFIDHDTSLTPDSVLDCNFASKTCAPLLTGATVGNQLAADATTLYWTIYGNSGSVQGALWQASSVTNVALAQLHPSHVAIDATYVYWTVGRTLVRALRAGPFTPQTVWTLPMGDTWEVPGSSNLGVGAGQLATDGKYVYVVYTEYGGLQRVEMCAVDGSACKDAGVPGNHYIGPIACANGFLVWTDYTYLVAQRVY